MTNPRTTTARGRRAGTAAVLLLSIFASAMATQPAIAAPTAPAFSDAPYAQDELIRPPNAHEMGFGTSMAVSGNTLVIGAPHEKGSVTSTLASPNELCLWCGAVYVYERRNDAWVLTDYLKAYNADRFDSFGASVAIEGDTLLVGAHNEDSAPGASYTDTLSDTSNSNIGAVYLFTRTAGSWNFDQLIKPTGAEDTPNFGSMMEIDGDTFVVGATEENYLRGAVYVFTRSAGVWSQQARLTKPNRAIGERFGTIALDGDTLAVGAADEGQYTGAVYMFTRSGISWTLQTRLAAFNGASGDGFGASLALHNGTLAVGAEGESGSITSTIANPNTFGYSNGAVYVYTGSGANWTLQAYLKPFNSAEELQFGGGIAVQTDTLVIGGRDNGSITSTAASSNTEASQSGAVYVYGRSGSTWSMQQYIKASRPDEYDYFGTDTILLHNRWMFVDSYNDADENAWCNVKGATSGNVYFYQLGMPSATLDGLSLAGAVAVTNEVQSQPWFQSYYGCYDALLPATSGTVTVGYTTTAAGAAVQVAVSSTTNPAFQACAAAVCPVEVGDNVISVTVTATDTNSMREYVIRAYRPAPSNDAALADLTIAPGTLAPTFVSSTTSYTAAVPNAATVVTVTATTNDVGASVAYSATQGTCTSNVCTLNIGVNVITATVTASDGVTKRAYVVTITRDAAALSNDAALSALAITPGALHPSFVSSTLGYTETVAYATSVVTVTATRNHVAATLSYAASPGSCPQPVARATLPPPGIPCTLEVGVNLITVTVTAEDDTTQDYVITITREAAALSSDAALSGLAITPGALHPSFVSSTLGYTETVAYATSVVTVTATRNHVAATLSYAASPGSCQQPVARATLPPSGIPCTLEVGVNLITVTVSAEDDTTQDYVITITREAAPPGGIEIGNVWPRTGEPAGGMPVSLFGVGFTGAQTVTVDGAPVPFTVTHDGRIDLVMPPGVDEAFADFAVTTPNGTARADDSFQYVAPLSAEFDGQTGTVFTTTDGVVVNVPSQGVAGSFIITLTPVPPQAGLPGDVLMHSFRLDALLNGAPIAVLSQPITIQLPVDVSIVPAGERPWLYIWTANEERGERSEERENLTAHSSSLTSSAAGRWTLVAGQSYDAANQRVTVALKPMQLYALSTTLIRDYWFPLVPLLR